MTIERRRFRWIFPLVALILFGAAAAVSYNMGVAQGLAETASGAATTSGHAWHGHYWHGPGFLPVLFFGLFWIFILRALFWAGPWRRSCGPGPWGYHGWRDARDAEGFDEWHRRAHERMKEAPPADDPGRGR